MAAQPTVDEAVRIMGFAMTEQQRRLNLQFWREKYGERYVGDIQDRLNGKPEKQR